MKLLLCLLFLLNSELLLAEDQSKLSKIIQILGGALITAEMSDVLAEKPLQLVSIRSTLKQASRYSEIICDVVGEKRHTRDEVDAVRHFIVSSMLSARFGYDFSLRFLTAHENRGDHRNDENIMDIQNNKQGLLFGQEEFLLKHFPLYIASLDFYKQVIFEKIKHGDFFVLESGISACTNTKYFPNM